MKKILVFLLLSLSIFLFGCNQNGDNQLSDKIRLEITTISENTEDKDIYIRYPVIGGLEDEATLSLINNSISKYVETRQQEFSHALANVESEVITTTETDTTGTATDEDTTETTEQTTEETIASTTEETTDTSTETASSMSLTMTFKIVYNQNNILNITEKFYQTLGEKKKTTGIQSFIFDLKHGKVITLGDLFDFSGDFAKVINAQIQTQIEADPTLITFEDKSGFTGISKDSNYYIDGENLYIFYDAYEIGPSKTTIPTFVIPLKDIKSYFNSDYQHIFI